MCNLYILNSFFNSMFMHLNSVQKFCCNGFSKFLLLYVILGPTSLWGSYWCRPPLMSPAGPVHVRAPGKALISWEKSWNWETHPQTKTIWHPWKALHEQIWKHQQFSLLYLGVVISVVEKFVRNHQVWLHTVYLETWPRWSTSLQ